MTADSGNARTVTSYYSKYLLRCTADCRRELAAGGTLEKTAHHICFCKVEYPHRARVPVSLSHFRILHTFAGFCDMERIFVYLFSSRKFLLKQ